MGTWNRAQEGLTMKIQTRNPHRPTRFAKDLRLTWRNISQDPLVKSGILIPNQQANNTTVNSKQKKIYYMSLASTITPVRGGLLCCVCYLHQGQQTFSYRAIQHIFMTFWAIFSMRSTQIYCHTMKAALNNMKIHLYENYRQFPETLM